MFFGLRTAPPQEKMLQSTIEESDALAANTDNRENEIVVSASEDETKLFWSVEYSEQLSA